MWIVEDEVREILNKLPSEGSFIDYKSIPYQKNKKHDFIKDVVAMLNSPENTGKNRYILFGVTDDKKLIGIDPSDQLDDATYQNWADKIIPRPNIYTGTLNYENLIYGYVCILDINEYAIYEVKESVSGNENLSSIGKNAVLQGQAFLRRGSKNYVMMQLDREQLMKQMRKYSIQYLPSNLIPDSKSEILPIIALVGGWDENVKGDCKAIEYCFGNEYTFFQSKLRVYYSENREIMSFSNGIWKLNDRETILQKIQSDIYDDQISKLYDITLKVFCSTQLNSKYLSDEQSNTSDNTSYKYSETIQNSLLDFWAYAANNANLFKSLSPNTIERFAGQIIVQIFQSDDWIELASDYYRLRMLAEIYPYVILREIEETLSKRKKELIQFVTCDSEKVYVKNKIYVLANSIGMLSMYKDLFAKAGMILAGLAEYCEIFAEELVTILLPWHPQTEANADSRIGLLKAVFLQNRSVAWSVIIQLMPNAKRSTVPIEYPRYYIPPNIKENNDQDYWEEIEKIVELACDKAEGNSACIEALINIIDDVNEPSREMLCNLIERNIASFSEDQNYRIWLNISDLQSKHRKNRGVKWGLSKEDLNSIGKIADRIENTLWFPRERRMFRKERWKLYDDVDSGKDPSECIANLQKKSATRIWKLGKESFFKFISAVEDQKLLGQHLATIDSSEDMCLFSLQTIYDDDEKYKMYAEGYIQASYYNENAYLLEYLQKVEPQKAIIIYEILPLNKDGISCAEKIEEIGQLHYYKNVNLSDVHMYKDVFDSELIEKLIKAERYNEIIDFLYVTILQNDNSLNCEMVARFLIELPYEENSGHSYEIGRFISFVQNSTLDEIIKLKIEWKYLDIIIHEIGIAPKTIYKSIVDSPKEFVGIFSKVYRGKSINDTFSYDHNSFLLLDSWKSVPGVNDEGFLDWNVFFNWFVQVVKLADEMSRKDAVEEYVGGILYYTPADSDGLFIDRRVAELLHNDCVGNIRRGYFLEALNSRGGYLVDPTGAPEFELENKYLKKAEICEKEGYVRFSDTLRLIAENYHKEALHNIEEARTWDK